MNISGEEILEIGFKEGPIVGYLKKLVEETCKSKKQAKTLLKRIYHNPEKAKEYLYGEEIYNCIYPPKKYNYYELNEKSLNFPIYGEEYIDPSAIDQMHTVCKLPVVHKGSLMPDAHVGKGMNIGGVLACENAVIPSCVSVDIGCRMALTLYDVNTSYLKSHEDKAVNALKEHTAFGSEKEPKKRYDDEVLERKEFNEIKKLKELHTIASAQIGSSGGGNHFVEFGIVHINDNSLGIEPGEYIGLLTHSGSRGFGAKIAHHYMNIAKEKCKLPKEAQDLAWLDMDSEEGQEYWIAMNLAGDYAKACHDHIHQKLAKYMGWKPIKKIENHHNFAWKEQIDGKEYIVHRKGATPANKDELGIIPGSMTSKGYIVKGKGNENAINSASHGAGRVMSRREAKESITKSELNSLLQENDVNLIGGGLDEAPIAYKDIEEVIKSQKDLVDVIGDFTPKIVRMAND